MSSTPGKDFPAGNEPLLDSAADWFVRVQNGELDMHETAAWERWVAADPNHRQAFDRMQDLWEGLGRLPERNLPSIEPPVTQRHWGWAAVVAAVLVGGAGAAYWKDRVLSEHVGASSVFQTAAGEHRDLKLPDGSQLVLGGASLAWIDFSESGRRVTLDRGEVFFTVAKERGRPFVVRTGTATITALGTAFNVRKAGERVQVAVVEGSVKVARSEETPTGQAVSTRPTRDSVPHARHETHLEAGQQLTVEATATPPKVSATDPQTITAWRNGQLQYLGEPLKYVVDDLNRYSKRRITIEDPAVGELRLSGTIFENDIDAWLRSVEDLLPVTVRYPSPEQIVLARR